jgi:hypothetical protein
VRANDSLQCVPSRRMLPLVALVMLSTLGPARAAPYTVSLDFVDESSSEPLHRERSVELPPSTIDQRVYAGQVGWRSTSSWRLFSMSAGAPLEARAAGRGPKSPTSSSRGHPAAVQSAARSSSRSTCRRRSSAAMRATTRTATSSVLPSIARSTPRPAAPCTTATPPRGERAPSSATREAPLPSCTP